MRVKVCLANAAKMRVEKFCLLMVNTTIDTRTHLINSSFWRSSTCWSRTVYRKLTQGAHMVSIHPDCRATHLVNRLLVSLSLQESLHPCIMLGAPVLSWRGLWMLWGVLYNCTRKYTNTQTLARTVYAVRTQNLQTPCEPTKGVFRQIYTHVVIHRDTNTLTHIWYMPKNNLVKEM